MTDPQEQILEEEIFPSSEIDYSPEDDTLWEEEFISLPCEECESNECEDCKL